MLRLRRYGQSIAKAMTGRGIMVLLSSHRPCVLAAVPANEGSPVRSTGRGDSYEVKGMTVDTFPEVMSLAVRGDRG